MPTFEEIKEKYTEFCNYLNAIDLTEFKNKHSREELEAFRMELYNISPRSLAYDISKLTEEMKKEEYPDLLGIHNYPILKKIDFLTEEVKLELDKHLLGLRVGNYLYTSTLWKFAVTNEKLDMLRDFLTTNGVIEKMYFVRCDNCGESYISKKMTEAEKEDCEKLFKRFKETKDYSDYENLGEYLDLESICMDCDTPTEINQITELRYKEVLIMRMERDKSLDNV